MLHAEKEDTVRDSGKWRHWQNILWIVGGISMLLGAIDPMEGSLLILPGSGLMALAAYFDREGTRSFRFRLLVFGMISFGIGALFFLSYLGGFGGTTGPSIWWGLLVIPYIVGWVLGVCGPDTPLWLLIGGICVGTYYLLLPVLIGTVKGEPLVELLDSPLLAIVFIGLVIIAGGIYRLRKRNRLR